MNKVYLAILFSISVLLNADPVKELPWSFLALEEKKLPDVKNSEWVQNRVDPFILAKMKVAGVEPAEAGEGTPANKRDSAHSPEALIKILINLSDSDRRMLSQIVERWGSLSDELKRAVLRVVG